MKHMVITIGCEYGARGNAVLLPVIAEYNALADHGRYLKIYNYISKIPAMAADAMKSGNIAVNPRASRQCDIEMLYKQAL